MSRLTLYTKQRIVNLDKKGFRIFKIEKILLEENIKVSRQAISKFIKRYREFKTFNNLSISNDARPKKLTKEKELEIINCIKANPEINANQIIRELDLNVSKYTVYRTIKKYGYKIQRKCKAIQRNKYCLAGSTNSPKKVSKKASQPTSPETTTHNQINPVYDHLIEEKLARLTNDQVAENFERASSVTNFASRLLKFFYRDEELLGKNVYGRVFKKDAPHKDALDSKIIARIEELVNEKYPEAQGSWSKCVKVLNQQIIRINNKLCVDANTGNTNVMNNNDNNSLNIDINHLNKNNDLNCFY